MVTLIFRAKVKEGKEDEAHARLTKMCEAVQANEPGALAYVCNRLQDDPREIVFFEVYADDAAFKAHSETPHMAELRGAFAELFDTATVKVERLERVAGFARAG
jgi:quinol monooxygenase YgiN